MAQAVSCSSTSQIFEVLRRWHHVHSSRVRALHPCGPLWCLARFSWLGKAAAPINAARQRSATTGYGKIASSLTMSAGCVPRHGLSHLKAMLRAPTDGGHHGTPNVVFLLLQDFRPANQLDRQDSRSPRLTSWLQPGRL